MNREPIRAGERLYRLLMRLYPRDFREEYRHDLLQAYRDRRRERRFLGLAGTLRLVAYLGFDLARSLPAAHRRAWAHNSGRTTRERRATMIEHFLQDLRFALRSCRRQPAFLLASTVTLALGAGAGTTVFSVVDGVALRPLPYPDADRLVAIGVAYEGRAGPGPMTPADFFDWQARSLTVEAMTASRLETLTLLGEGPPTAISGAGVSAEFFEVLGVNPVLGRTFAPDEDRPSGDPVAVLAHGLWERRFGADPDILGRTLSLDDRTFTVVGVMPRSFHPPEALHHGDVQIWYPLAHVEEDLQQRSSAFLQGAGRMAEDVTPGAVRRELQQIAEAVRADDPDAQDLAIAVVPLHEVTVGESGSTLLVLLGAVGFLLVLTCANVAHLFLVRATERDREMAVRTAMGAERSRLVRQLLTEGLLIAGIGGVLAVAVAHAGLAIFRTTSPGDLPRLAEVGIDARVLLFALVLTLGTGVLFGLVPLARTPNRRLSASLREGTGRSSSGAPSNRLRNVLVVGQTAVALILLVGAGLLMNSFVRLRGVDPGFEPTNAVWIRVSVSSEDYPGPEQRVAFFTEVKRRFEALPGVRRVGGTENIPLGRNRSLDWVTPEGLELRAGDDPPVVSYHRVTPGFFQALAIPLLRGRSFTDRDDGASPPVVVVNRRLADTFWPGGDPLGQRVKVGSPDGDWEWRTVVGVVGDVRQGGLGTPPEPELYTPWLQAPRTNLTFVVRGPEASAGLLPVLTREVWAVDPTLPLDRLGTLEGHVAAGAIEPRFYTIVLSSFAGVALILALIGLYGTMALTVELRSHELGVKMALGAGRKRVLGDVLRTGGALLAAGLVLGLAGATASTRVLEGFVFGVTLTDPATLAVTSVVLGATGLVACWLPARRATRLDPVETLRSE